MLAGVVLVGWWVEALTVRHFCSCVRSLGRWLVGWSVGWLHRSCVPSFKRSLLTILIRFGRCFNTPLDVWMIGL